MTDISRAALVVIDVQNDFCPGGSLAVPEGDLIVPVLNRCISLFTRAGRPVLYSRDWHPAVTTHFAGQGGVWPPHCIQDTPGAAFHRDLLVPEGAMIVSKGMGAREDAYSAFQARLPDGALLAELLHRAGVTEVYTGGLATDYCVNATVLDALKHGFTVHLLEDACRAVDLQPGDGARALAEMTAAGAHRTTAPVAMR